MKIEQYRREVKRTLVVLPTSKQNSIHMAYGVITEIGELVDIYKKELAYGKEKDKVNLKEEAGDIMWYIANTFNFMDLSDEEVQHFDTLGSAMEVISKRVIGNTDFEPIDKLMHLVNLSNKFFQSALSNDAHDIGALAALIRHELTLLCKMESINIEECFELNINKLKARYPEKFTQDSALNRDLNKERDSLNGKKIY